MIAVLPQSAVALGGNAHVNVVRRIALKPVAARAVGEYGRPRFIWVIFPGIFRPKLEPGVGDGSAIQAGANYPGEHVPVTHTGANRGVWLVAGAYTVVKRGRTANALRRRWRSRNWSQRVLAVLLAAAFPSRLWGEYSRWLVGPEHKR